MTNRQQKKNERSTSYIKMRQKYQAYAHTCNFLIHAFFKLALECDFWCISCAFLVNVYASSTVCTIVCFCQYVGPSPLIQSQLLMINCQMLLWLPIKWGHSTLTSVNQGFPLSMEFQKFHHKSQCSFSLFVLTIPWNATSHNTSKKQREYTYLFGKWMVLQI